MTQRHTIHRDGEAIEIAVQFERRPSGIEITQASHCHHPFTLTAEEDRQIAAWLEDHADV